MSDFRVEAGATDLINAVADQVIAIRWKGGSRTADSRDPLEALAHYRTLVKSREKRSARVDITVPRVIPQRHDESMRARIVARSDREVRATDYSSRNENFVRPPPRKENGKINVAINVRIGFRFYANLENLYLSLHEEQSSRGVER